MMLRMPSLVFTFPLVLLVTSSDAFTSLHNGHRKFSAASRRRETSASSLRLHYNLRNSEGGNAPEELQKLEEARAAFEDLISEHLAPDTLRSIDRSQPHLVLTSTGRRLRELEMELVATLKYSDSAIEELIHLWTTERDQEASTALLTMQNACSEGLVQEEHALRDMCDAYPGWAEPYSRLATLLYYTGRVEEAVVAADVATSLKPWHFEALRMGVLLANCENPAVRVQAAHMVDKAMPPVEEEEARSAWVENSLRMAAKQLQDAEDATNAKKSPFAELTVSEIWQ